MENENRSVLKGPMRIQVLAKRDGKDVAVTLGTCEEITITTNSPVFSRIEMPPRTICGSLHIKLEARMLDLMVNEQVLRDAKKKKRGKK